MVFMEDKVNIKGPDSHQCSLVGGPGTIERGAPLAWQGRDPFYPLRIKDSRPLRGQNNSQPGSEGR